MTSAQSGGATATSPAATGAAYLQRQDVALAQLFNLAHDMLCIAGFDGYYKQVNPAWERTLGWTREELTSRPYIEFVHPDDRLKTASKAGDIEEGSTTLHFENRYRHRDGSYRWLSWTASPSPSEGLIYAAARDVTSVRHAAQLAEAQHAVTAIAARATEWPDASQAILRAVCGALDWEMGALWVVDDSGRYLRWEDAYFTDASLEHTAGRELGTASRRPGESLVGLAWERGEPTLTADVRHDSRFDPSDEAVREQFAGGFAFPYKHGGRVLGVMAFGTREPQRVTGDVKLAAEALATQVDALFERLTTSREMQHRAFHDAMTGLPNLALFRERARDALAAARRLGHEVAIGIADVDKFKEINDTLGHAVGDEVLRVVARRLRDCLRAGDTVARIGGDEFGIVLPSTARAGAVAATRKLRAALASGIPIGDDRLMVRVSLGFAVADAGELEHEALLRRADSDMYRDKAIARGA